MALQAVKLQNCLKTPLFVRLLSAPASGSVNKHNPNGWKSWQDIPDSMIPTTSKIDPDNDIYKERQYINLRKKQIWYQIPDGTPIWLKNGTRDKMEFYFSYMAVFGILAYTLYEFYFILRYGKKEK